MLEVIRDPKKMKIEVNDVIDKIERGDQIVVFYYTNNAPEGCPAFLKWHNKQAYFMSSMPTYRDTYSCKDLKECLTRVLKSRKLYMATPNEMALVFREIENNFN